LKEVLVAQEPIIVPEMGQRTSGRGPIAMSGGAFSVHEWEGSGPAYLHVHHYDDEAWHIIEGTFRFRFAEREVDASAGTTVFVPAGVPHTYEAIGAARYLIILTPRLQDLIAVLHGAPVHEHREIMGRFQSEMLD
jgi:mannose-6-phosphate isomerase-like protein (cupin superfamily)